MTASPARVHSARGRARARGPPPNPSGLLPRVGGPLASLRTSPHPALPATLGEALQRPPARVAPGAITRHSAGNGREVPAPDRDVRPPAPRHTRGVGSDGLRLSHGYAHGQVQDAHRRVVRPPRGGAHRRIARARAEGRLHELGEGRARRSGRVRAPHARAPALARARSGVAGRGRGERTPAPAGVHAGGARRPPGAGHELRGAVLGRARARHGRGVPALLRRRHAGRGRVLPGWYPSCRARGHHAHRGPAPRRRGLLVPWCVPYPQGLEKEEQLAGQVDSCRWASYKMYAEPSVLH